MDLDNPNIQRHLHDYPYGHGDGPCGFRLTTLQHRLGRGMLRQRREQPARRAYARWQERSNLKDFTAFVPDGGLS